MNSSAASKDKNAILFFVLNVAILLISTLGGRAALAQTEPSDCMLVTPDKMPVSVTAAVERDGEQLVIKGTVTRHCEPKKILWGHIDVIVTDKSGKNILNLPIAYRPNPVIQRPSAVSHFKWSIPSSVTPGSRIELRYVGGAHESH